jgi:hypothetical protein
VDFSLALIVEYVVFFLMGWHRPPAMIDIDTRLAHWASSRHLSDGPKEFFSYVQDE